MGTMKVKEVIELLQGLNQEEELLAPSLMSFQDYLYEFQEWVAREEDIELPKELAKVAKDNWTSLAQGVGEDDRIHEAIDSSLNFDFRKMFMEYKERQATDEEQQLWDKEQ